MLRAIEAELSRSLEPFALPPLKGNPPGVTLRPACRHGSLHSAENLTVTPRWRK